MNGNEVVSTASENPFRASRIKPGAIPYVFPAGQNVAALVDRLRETGWWGEVVGPHGSGKSTLLETLIPAIHRADRPTVLVALHDGQRRLPREFIKPRSVVAPWGATTGRGFMPAILVIDGYEQLGYWSRWIVKRFCRRRGIGLMVTAHASVGLPELYRTDVTSEAAERVVGRLLGGRSAPFSSQEVSERLAQHGGDLRETLFDLYDIYEQRRPSSGQNVT